MDEATADSIMLALSDKTAHDLQALDSYDIRQIWQDVPMSDSAEFATIAGH